MMIKYAIDFVLTDVNYSEFSDISVARFLKSHLR